MLFRKCGIDVFGNAFSNVCDLKNPPFHRKNRLFADKFAEFFPIVAELLQCEVYMSPYICNVIGNEQRFRTMTQN